MPIKFDKKGNPKPYEIVEVKLEQFEKIFSTMPNIARRKELYDNLKNYICDFYQTLFPESWTQWYGGSYTTKKELPNDIDVVNIIDHKTVEQGCEKIQPFLTAFEITKKKYYVDGYVVPIYSKDDPKHEITVDLLNYWSKLFGNDRDNNPKALIEVSYNDTL